MLKLTTTVYKYKRYAPLIMGAIALATILLFLFSEKLSPIVNALGIALLAGVAIYTSLRPKSLFSVRSVDERKLVFTPDHLEWGTWLIPMHELENLDVYIYAFNTFRHVHVTSTGRRTYTTEYGDRNTLSFTYRGIKYDLTFYLGNFIHYNTLIEIMQSWSEQEIIFSVESAFGDAYIREQVNLYGE